MQFTIHRLVSCHLDRPVDSAHNILRSIISNYARILSILFAFGTSVGLSWDWVFYFRAILMQRILSNEEPAGHRQFASMGHQAYPSLAIFNRWIFWHTASSSGVHLKTMSLERSSFRRNFQGWVELNYGENSRTKTITRKKFNKICRYLLGEPQIETDAKFRFWVKSKGFRIVHMDDGRSYGVLYVPVKVPAHTRVSKLE